MPMIDTRKSAKVVAARYLTASLHDKNVCNFNQSRGGLPQEKMTGDPWGGIR